MARDRDSITTEHHRKWHARYRMVTWLMTSWDAGRSKLWPGYI